MEIKKVYQEFVHLVLGFIFFVSTVTTNQSPALAASFPLPSPSSSSSPAPSAPPGPQSVCGPNIKNFCGAVSPVPTGIASAIVQDILNGKSALSQFKANCEQAVKFEILNDSQDAAPYWKAMQQNRDELRRQWGYYLANVAMDQEDCVPCGYGLPQPPDVSGLG